MRKDKVVPYLSPFSCAKKGLYMPEDLNEDNTNPQESEATQTSQTSPAEFEAAVKARVDAELAKVKESLNKSYGQRDDAVRKAADLEERLKRLEIEALEKEGKTAEALQMRLKEMEAKYAAASEENLKLSRDQQVKDAIATLPFRNDRARAAAFEELRKSLVRDENGLWVHKTGSSISDAVKAFEEDTENEFYFKPSQNQGSSAPGFSKPKRPDSLKNLTGPEIIELARKGLLNT